MKNSIIVILLFSLHAEYIFSQEKQATGNVFSLKDAVTYAIKNNVANQNGVIDSEIAKAKKSEVTGLGLPQINSNFDLKDYEKIPTSIVPGDFFGQPGTLYAVQFGTRYNATGTVQASQLVFNSDYLVGLQASKTYLELSEKAVTRTNIETSASVMKAYYNVLINRERLKLLIANIARIGKLKSDTKALNENGFVEKIDLDRIEVAYNNLVSEKQKVEKFIGLSEVMLKFQMGYDVSQPITLSDSLSVNVNSNLNGKDKITPSNRIEYSLLQSQLKLNELELKRNRLGYLPSLVAYASASANAQRNTFNFLDTKEKWYPIVVVGGTFNLPIFDGLQKHYRIQQSKLNLLKTKNTIKNLENAINMETMSAQVVYENAVTSLSAQQKNMELAENVYRVVKAKYDQGVGSNIEVITAETSLRESQTNYFNAMYDYIVAKVDYDKATGNIK